MVPDNTAPHPDNSAPHGQLPSGRRSFPSPRRRGEPVYEEAGSCWQYWAVRGLLALAVVMAAAAAWIKLRPDNTSPPAPPSAAGTPGPEPLTQGPPDAARDIYLSGVLPDPAPTLTPTPTPTLTPAPTENPPAPSRDLTDLEARYLGALTAAMKHVPETARAEFATEIERLNTDAPLPAPSDGVHPELARLQSIYRLQLARQLQR